ncbi:MAG: ABC transporter permease [Planctomycetes bacterium]|nr:ABC transporter permease [Planctomycetota bacterium]
MKMLKYLTKRLAIFIPLFFGVILATFLLVRMLPGSPAEAMAGSMAYEETIRSLEAKMGLDKPLYEQFFIYVWDVLHGDLGQSWFTSRPVAVDIFERFPATFELITLSVLGALILGVALGAGAAVNPRGIASKISRVYGMLAGSFADFWLALMLIYFFFTVAGIAPAPMGRLDLLTFPPPRVTGMFTIDSLLAGDMYAFWDAVAHLALPVATLALVNGSIIMKMTSSTMSEIIESDYIHHARMMGLSNRTIRSYALRNALPAVITAVGNIYSFLLGGAVLVESVFSWGGLGQYVTSALSNKDYAAIQGFVLVATVFSMLIYLVIDIIYMMIDPRVKF